MDYNKSRILKANRKRYAKCRIYLKAARRYYAHGDILGIIALLKRVAELRDTIAAARLAIKLQRTIASGECVVKHRVPQISEIHTWKF